MVDEASGQEGIGRRALLKRAAAAGVASSLPLIGAACGSSGSSANPTSTSTSTSTSAQKPGGTIRAVFSGWATNTTFDPQAPAGSATDIAWRFAMFERLVDPSPFSGDTQNVLAEAIESNAAGDVWTIKLRKGVVWQDGSPFTADDVVYSLKRILTKSLGLEGYSVLQMVDSAGIAKLDSHTVRVPLQYPYSDFLAQLSQRQILMIKNGTTHFTPPVGTGPFRYVSQQAGQSMSFVRNPHYWQHGLPYLDGVKLVNIADETAQLNALFAGQVDIIESVSGAGGRLADANAATKVQRVNSCSWNALVMNTATGPFSDVRVRQAMRLLANRPADRLAAQNGLGFLGNDLFSIQDGDYDHSFPQRAYDPEQAKALLTKAGMQNFQFTLHAADLIGGLVSTATAFADQAVHAGVKLSVQQHPAATYTTSTYMKVPFFVTSTGGRSLLATWLLLLAPNAPTPETAWRDPESAKLLKEALRSVDDTKRRPIVHEMQKIQWDRGGYLLPFFITFITPMSKTVNGLMNNIWQPVNNYSFVKVSLTS
jgi:peptide/nickel transport system substrate-binding protein